MNQFVTAVWNLLLTVGPQVKYDMLASNAIQFLASVADRQQYKGLFEDHATLSSICEKVIIPNIEMRECDTELFEDNPEEYIRRDLEGSDVDTRRRAACDLVKGLSRFFEPQITPIFSNYVKVMLERYQTDRNKHWKSKDAALFLVTSLATRAKTAKHGITQTNQLVDLADFCRKYVLDDLQSPEVDSLPVVKADVIKYVLTFRSQLPPEVVKSCLPLLVHHLKAQSHVVHTYAAAAIDKILIMRGSLGDGQQQLLVNASDLQPIAEPLLAGLFGAFSLPGSTENEYVMKCVMRSFSTLKEGVIPYLSQLLPTLTEKVAQAAKNPTRPHYNHYLFETLGLSIRIVCRAQKEAVASFEAVLFPVFQDILQQDVQEFVPYVFQILSLLLEVNSAQGGSEVPQPYMQLFPFLMMPVLWERPGNVTPLVRLIQAYVARGPQQIVALNKLESLLGIFQKLVASRSNDHEGFYMLQTLVEHLPESAMTQYIKPVFMLLFQRLTSSKTTKFVRNFLVFSFLYVTRYGGASLVQTVDAIQANMFGMVCERLIVAEVQRVSGAVERKICAVGLTRLLCETPALLTGAYASYWPALLQALLGLLELPPDESTPDDEHFVEIEETPGYQAAYSQLAFAGRPERDPLSGVANPRHNLAAALHKLSVGSPGMVSPLVEQLTPQAKGYLQGYLQAANLTIN